MRYRLIISALCTVAALAVTSCVKENMSGNTSGEGGGQPSVPTRGVRFAISYAAAEGVDAPELKNLRLYIYRGGNGQPDSQKWLKTVEVDDMSGITSVPVPVPVQTGTDNRYINIVALGNYDLFGDAYNNDGLISRFEDLNWDKNINNQVKFKDERNATSETDLVDKDEAGRVPLSYAGWNQDATPDEDGWITYPIELSSCFARTRFYFRKEGQGEVKVNQIVFKHRPEYYLLQAALPNKTPGGWWYDEGYPDATVESGFQKELLQSPVVIESSTDPELIRTYYVYTNSKGSDDWTHQGTGSYKNWVYGYTAIVKYQAGAGPEKQTQFWYPPLNRGEGADVKATIKSDSRLEVSITIKNWETGETTDIGFTNAADINVETAPDPWIDNPQDSIGKQAFATYYVASGQPEPGDRTLFTCTSTQPKGGKFTVSLTNGRDFKVITEKGDFGATELIGTKLQFRVVPARSYDYNWDKAPETEVYVSVTGPDGVNLGEQTLVWSGHTGTSWPGGKTTRFKVRQVPTGKNPAE